MKSSNKNDRPIQWAFAGALAGASGFISGRSLWLQTDSNLLTSILIGVLVTLFLCFVFYKPIEVISSCRESFRMAKKAVHERRLQAQKEKEANAITQKQWSNRRLRLYKKMTRRVCMFHALCSGLNAFLWVGCISIFMGVPSLLVGYLYSNSLSPFNFSEAFNYTIQICFLVSISIGLIFGIAAWMHTPYSEEVLEYWYFSQSPWNQKPVQHSFRKNFTELRMLDFFDNYHEREMHEYILRNVSTFKRNNKEFVSTKFSMICMLACKYFAYKFMLITPVYIGLQFAEELIRFSLSVFKKIPRHFNLTSLWIRTFTLELFIHLNTKARIAIISCACIGYTVGWTLELVGHQQSMLMSFGSGLVFGLAQNLVYKQFSRQIKVWYRALLIRRAQIA